MLGRKTGGIAVWVIGNLAEIESAVGVAIGKSAGIRANELRDGGVAKGFDDVAAEFAFLYASGWWFTWVAGL